MTSMQTSAVATILLLAAAAAATASQPGYDRYQPIVDRKPFGALLPPGPPPGQDPNQAGQPSFAESLRLSMIVEEEDTGFQRIGFVDKRTNRGYTLGVGEAEDGYEVVSADFEKEEAVLRQGGETAMIKLSSGEVTKLGPDGKPVAGAPAAAPAMTPPMPGGQQPAQPAGNMSYAERRRMRQLQMQQQMQQAQQQPKYTGEELAKHLSEYKLEVIRQGLPALPIPLTADEDNQLVKEGVLPPVQ